MHNIFSPKFSSPCASEPESELSHSDFFEINLIESFTAKNYHREADLNRKQNISFNLSDTYEELKVQNYLSIDTKGGVNHDFNQDQDLDESVEPLLSISPQKELTNNYQDRVESACLELSNKLVTSKDYYYNSKKNLTKDTSKSKYKNDSYEQKRQSLCHINDHFSSFSSAIDFNNIRFLKQPSIDQNIKSTDTISINPANNTNLSNKL